MTKLLDQAVETARNLPADVQDDIARIVLSLAGEEREIITLNKAEEASIALSRSQAKRREFATDEQVRAIWSKHGL
ncbi:MAG: hypothetical protein JWM58_998 [Rhizobium sp.]|nr:hypothetical protein [Rhizobium sp.]